MMRITEAGVEFHLETLKVSSRQVCGRLPGNDLERSDGSVLNSMSEESDADPEVGAGDQRRRC